MLAFGRCLDDGTSGSLAVCLFFSLLTIAIFARIILSWFQMDPRSPIVQALHQFTEPILEPLRRVIPRLGMFDLSPIAALILLSIISRVLQQFMIDAGI